MNGRGEKGSVALPHKSNRTAALEAEEKKKRKAKRRKEDSEGRNAEEIYMYLNLSRTAWCRISLEVK